jgi:hypothetical protein
MATDKKLSGVKITCIGQASLDDTHGGATRLKTRVYRLNEIGG